MQATAVWAAVGRADGRPVALGPEFHRLYDGAAQGRSASVRLSHPRPPATPAGGAWPLRASDFDTLGHVNNAIHWAAVEDVLAGLDWLPDGAELEYHRPVLPGCEPLPGGQPREEPGQPLAAGRDSAARVSAASSVTAGR